MYIKGVNFAYKEGKNRIPIFKDQSFNFITDKIHSIIGKSGCGKTTLLYLLAGLLKPDSGIIKIQDDSKPPSENMRSSIILQDFGLFPWKKVHENISLGLKIRKTAKEKIDTKLSNIMGELSIEHLKDEYPGRLSGGEKQKVAIARTLVMEPNLLLMDEPFSSLDAMNRELMQNFLLKIHEKHKMTVILVTHSIEEAAFVSDWIHIMKRTFPFEPADILPEIKGPEIKSRDSSKNLYSVTDKLRSALYEEQI